MLVPLMHLKRCLPEFSFPAEPGEVTPGTSILLAVPSAGTCACETVSGQSRSNCAPLCLKTCSFLPQTRGELPHRHVHPQGAPSAHFTGGTSAFLLGKLRHSRTWGGTRHMDTDEPQYTLVISLHFSPFLAPQWRVGRHISSSTAVSGKKKGVLKYYEV